MPQLDFFTLLFQFKSFFFFYLLIYLFFLFIFIPRLQFIITVRRLQVLKLLSYYTFLKLIIYDSFSKQCLLIKKTLSALNEIYNILFNKYLIESKYNITSLLFSKEHFSW